MAEVKGFVEPVPDEDLNLKKKNISRKFSRFETVKHYNGAAVSKLLKLVTFACLTNIIFC